MSEADFLMQCRNELLSKQPSAAFWVDDHCGTRWRQALATASMVDAILALAPEVGAGRLSAYEARARLPMVQWSSEGVGTLDEAAVDLTGRGSGLAFSWQGPGTPSPYNLIDALRIRGINLRTLGCPQYSMVSMGREKVVAAELAGQPTFVLTVYSRPPPTGIDQGIYQVHVDFSGRIPDLTALRAGRYPGGGGRAFASAPTDWSLDCPDPN